MRTFEEIVEKCRKQNERVMEFQMEILLPLLPFAYAKEFLKADTTAEQWHEPPTLTREIIINEMRDYMAFAWDKAENHRGISASRSVDKMRAWLWLLDDQELLEFNDYAQYGDPILAAISKKYDFPIPQSPALEAMIKGEMCPECQSGESAGCGR